MSGFYPPSPSSGGISSPNPSPSILWSRDGSATFVGTWPNIHNFIEDGGAPTSPVYGYDRASNVTNETVYWTVWLAKGKYKLDVIVEMFSNQGISECLLDGVSQFTFDDYAAGNNTAVYKVVGSITATYTGLHILTFRVTGTKNPLGTDFWLGIFGVVIRGSGVGLYPFPTTGNTTPIIASGQSVLADNLNPNGWGNWVTLGNAGKSSTNQNVSNRTAGGNPIYIDITTHASGYYLESEIWLDAGTYSLDGIPFFGTVFGVLKMTVDGTPLGTPQPANTLRQFGAPSNPGNGNNGGAALSAGEFDCYDSMVSAQYSAAIDGGTFYYSAMINMLTNIVIPSSDWHTIRFACSGKNSSSVNFDLAFFGTRFRRTA